MSWSRARALIYRYIYIIIKRKSAFNYNTEMIYNYSGYLTRVDAQFPSRRTRTQYVAVPPTP